MPITLELATQDSFLQNGSSLHVPSYVELELAYAEPSGARSQLPAVYHPGEKRASGAQDGRTIGPESGQSIRADVEPGGWEWAEWESAGDSSSKGRG